MKRLSVLLAVSLLLGACGASSTTTTVVDSAPDNPVQGSGEGIPNTSINDGQAADPVRETFTDLGQAHLSDADAAAVINGTMASPEYNSVPPTSGTHTPAWANCGIYRQVIPDAVQVHSLEHGAVIIQYNPEIDPADIAKLEDYARNKPSHVIVAPYNGLNTPIVVTAWTVRLQLMVVDLEVIDAFWLDYANEGPERVPCPMEIDEAVDPGA